MEYVNSIRYLSRMIFSLTAAGVLVSCVTTEKQSQQPPVSQVVLESKTSLLNWHDVTHKSYYGLKGVVKTLVIKPAVIKGDTAKEVSDEWELQFNRKGMLTSKRKVNGNEGFKTTYSYSEQGQLTHVASHRDGRLWRSSSFSYDKGQLVKIQYADKIANEQLTTKVSRQAVSDGRIDIELVITTPGLPTYSQYLSDNSLIWSSRGDINNGLGELYYLRTVDGVTSSSVVNQGTPHMQGRGGYRYKYLRSGLLTAVESYNAHANRLFHKTSYKYNKLGLLTSEEKKVTDSSPFNEAIDESVTYDYQLVDEQGNWINRKLSYKSRFQSMIFSETRRIEYY